MNEPCVNINIKRAMDHYEIYIDGVFLCSADTIEEVIDELESEGY